MIKCSGMSVRAMPDFSDIFSKRGVDAFDQQIGPTSDSGSGAGDDGEQAAETGEGGIVVSLAQSLPAASTYRRSLFRR